MRDVPRSRVWRRHGRRGLRRPGIRITGCWTCQSSSTPPADTLRCNSLAIWLRSPARLSPSAATFLARRGQGGADKDAFRQHIGYVNASNRDRFEVSWDPGFLSAVTHAVVLSLCDPIDYVAFPSDGVMEDIQNITFQNDLQLRSATRFVFSRSGDFALATEILDKYPEIGDPGRPRVQAG